MGLLSRRGHPTSCAMRRNDLRPAAAPRSVCLLAVTAGVLLLYLKSREHVGDSSQHSTERVQS